MHALIVQYVLVVPDLKCWFLMFNSSELYRDQKSKPTTSLWSMSKDNFLKETGHQTRLFWIVGFNACGSTSLIEAIFPLALWYKRPSKTSFLVVSDWWHITLLSAPQITLGWPKGPFNFSHKRHFSFSPITLLIWKFWVCRLSPAIGF